MHFNEFFNMCEKCLSDILYQTEGVFYFHLILIK